MNEWLYTALHTPMNQLTLAQWIVTVCIVGLIIVGGMLLFEWLEYLRGKLK